jgi:hypothetical protein
MMADAQLDRAATAAAEEVLRVIYGDDLQGCAVTLDSISAVIRAAFEEHLTNTIELAELHGKAFEAVQLLSTPPTDGKTLSAEELRSLLGERLDKIRELSTKVLGAMNSGRAESPLNGEAPGAAPDVD